MNFRLFEAELKKNGLTQEEFCKAINISLSKYHRAKKGKAQFSCIDIERSIRLLNITDPVAIFFSSEVS